MKQVAFRIDHDALRRGAMKEIVRAIALMPADTEGIAPDAARVPGVGAQSIIEGYTDQAWASLCRLTGGELLESKSGVMTFSMADGWPGSLQEGVERKMTRIMESLIVAGWLEGCGDKMVAEPFRQRAAAAATELRRMINVRVRN